MKLQRFTISGAGWKDILILRPTPEGDDPWGVLSCLQGTVWGNGIQVVDGEVFSHALHGHVMPLVRLLGRDPRALLRSIPEGYRICDLRYGCVMYTPKHCHPCPKVPDCFIPSGLEEDQVEAAAAVCRAWADGRYVLVVQGSEFSL